MSCDEISYLYFWPSLSNWFWWSTDCTRGFQRIAPYNFVIAWILIFESAFITDDHGSHVMNCTNELLFSHPWTFPFLPPYCSIKMFSFQVIVCRYVLLI